MLEHHQIIGLMGDSPLIQFELDKMGQIISARTNDVKAAATLISVAIFGAAKSKATEYWEGDIRARLAAAAPTDPVSVPICHRNQRLPVIITRDAAPKAG